MRNFTDEEIIHRVETLATFDGWKPGAYSIWVRSAADLYDAFDDKNFLYWVEADRPRFVMMRNGTTNAGSYGLKHFSDYNHDGCAVLKSDQFVRNAWVHGYHHHIQDGEHEAYVQSKSWPYYRDGDKDERAEEIGPIHTDVIGANDHHAGENSTVIKNWSVACMVTANRAKYREFLAFMKSKGFPPLSGAILKEW